MKKALSFLLAGLILITSCESSKPPPLQPQFIIPLNTATAEEIAQEIFGIIEIPSAMEQEIEDLEFFFSTLDTEGIEELSYHICASGAYPDELLIIKFGTAEQALAAKPAVEARLESRRGDFRDYAPAEMYKLDTALIMVNSNWLFFFVTEENLKVMAVVESFILPRQP
jgi:hypothetical protein